MKCYIHPDIDAVGTCTSCGKTVCSVCAMDVGGKVVCKQCAEAMAGQAAATAAATATASPASSSGQKSPALSLILSLIIPGLGQIVNGQVKKGVILLLGAIVAWIVASVIFGVSVWVCLCCSPVFYIIPVVVHLYAAYEAYDTAKKINIGEFTKDWLS